MLRKTTTAIARQGLCGSDDADSNIHPVVVIQQTWCAAFSALSANACAPGFSWPSVNCTHGITTCQRSSCLFKTPHRRCH